MLNSLTNKLTVYFILLCVKEHFVNGKYATHNLFLNLASLYIYSIFSSKF